MSVCGAKSFPVCCMCTRRLSAIWPVPIALIAIDDTTMPGNLSCNDRVSTTSSTSPQPLVIRLFDQQRSNWKDLFFNPLQFRAFTSPTINRLAGLDPIASASQTLVESEPEPDTWYLSAPDACVQGMTLEPSANLPNLHKYVLSATKSHSLNNGFAT